MKPIIIKFLKKFYIKIFFCLCSLNCSSQNKLAENKKLIYDFEKLILIKDTLNFKEFYNYCLVHKSLRNNEAFEYLVRDFIDTYKEAGCLRINLTKEVLSYSEVKDFSPEFKEKYKIKNIKHKHKKHLYFVKSNDGECFNIYVIKKGKIISFFPYIYVSQTKIRPFIFDKKLSDDDLIIMRL